MKKFIMMIAAVAMAGMMCSCGNKAASGDKEEAAKVEATEEADAPASDKPAKEQLKDAIATIKTACEEENFENLQKGLDAYVEGIKSVNGMDELMSLDKEPELDFAKALEGAKDPEKWCTPEQLKQLEGFKPKMEEAMTEVMKKFMPALQEGAEEGAEEGAAN